jgi:hypothetical protein
MPFSGQHADDDRRAWLAGHVDSFLPAELTTKKAKLEAERPSWAAFVVNRGMIYLGLIGFDVDSNEVGDRLKADIIAARQFLDDELGTTTDDQLPTTPGTLGMRTPPLIDLVDAHRTRPTMTRTSVAVVGPAKTAGVNRKRLVRKIAMRALALHGELWPTTPGTIDRTALREIIDRRLRIVEMMTFFVNTVDVAKSVWTVSQGTPQVPVWKDGERNRLFEYPHFENTRTRQISVLIEAARAATPPLIRPLVNDGDRDPPRPLTDEQVAQKGDWGITDEGTKDVSIEWVHPAPYPEEVLPPGPLSPGETPPDTKTINARMPTKDLRIQWQPSPKDNYTLCFYPPTPVRSGQTLAESIDALIRLRDTAGADVRLNLWDRAWLMCDHVISVLQIDALLFGWRRRSGSPTAEDGLNAVALRNPSTLVNNRPFENQYVWLGPMAQLEHGRSGGLLDGGGGNEFFFTEKKAYDAVEIGDHVMSWNSVVYDLLTGGGEWRVENAVVADLVEGDAGNINIERIYLRGHGLDGTSAEYASYFLDQTNTVLDKARREVAKKVNTNSSAKEHTWTVNEVNFVRAIKWLPYPGLQAGPGPDDIGSWWLVFQPDRTLWLKKRKREEMDVPPPATTKPREAVVEIPGAVGIEATGAGGYNVLTSVIGTSGFIELKVIPIPTGTGFIPFNADFPDLTLTDYIVFPLVRPKMSNDKKEKPFAWAPYFTARSTNVIPTKTVVPLVMDSSFIPGLRSPERLLWVNYPRVRPGP